MSAPLRGSLNDVNVISLKRGENWNECCHGGGRREEWIGVAPEAAAGARRCIYSFRLAGGENRGEVKMEWEGGERRWGDLWSCKPGVKKKKRKKFFKKKQVSRRGQSKGQKAGKKESKKREMEAKGE